MKIFNYYSPYIPLFGIYKVVKDDFGLTCIDNNVHFILTALVQSTSITVSLIGLLKLI